MYRIWIAENLFDYNAEQPETKYSIKPEDYILMVVYTWLYIWVYSVIYTISIFCLYHEYNMVYT